MSLYVLAWGGGLPFGALLLGSLAHAWGAGAALLLAGAVTAVYALLVAVRRPSVRTAA